MDPDTLEPSDILTPAALKWVRDVGSPATTVTEVIQTGDNVVIQQIQRGIDRVNSQAVSNAQRIQKWSVVPRDFSIHHGELGELLSTTSCIGTLSNTIVAMQERVGDVEAFGIGMEYSAHSPFLHLPHVIGTGVSCRYNVVSERAALVLVSCSCAVIVWTW